MLSLFKIFYLCIDINQYLGNNRVYKKQDNLYSLNDNYSGILLKTMYYKLNIISV